MLISGDPTVQVIKMFAEKLDVQFTQLVHYFVQDGYKFGYFAAICGGLILLFATILIICIRKYKNVKPYENEEYTLSTPPGAHLFAPILFSGIGIIITTMFMVGYIFESVEFFNSPEAYAIRSIMKIIIRGR